MMVSGTTDRDVLHILLQNDLSEFGGWVTLNQVISMSNVPHLEVSDGHIGMAAASLVDNVEAILRRLRADGLIETKDASPIFDTEFRLSELGLKKFDELYGLAPQDEFFDSDDAVRVDAWSSAWTGIEKRLDSHPRIVDEIRLKMKEIDRLVEAAGLTNEERQKAKAISEALVSLVESPQPEWRAIVNLLNTKPLTALLNLSSIVQLALKLIFGI